MPCLENLSAVKSEAPAVTDITLDGPAIVQMLKPGVSKTFEVYAKKVFLPYISLQLCKATRVDLVWDVYLNDSLKGTARLKRGQGIWRRVAGTGLIHGNLQNFLRVLTETRQSYSATYHKLSLKCHWLITSKSMLQMESRFLVIQENKIMQL